MSNHPHFDASGIPVIPGGVTNPAKFGKAITSILIRCIRLYQKLISPLLGQRCRFYPTCSQYAIESFEKRGLCSGSIQTIKRLGRCQPWHPGGVDLP